jgi:hypothetical protein
LGALADRLVDFRQPVVQKSFKVAEDARRIGRVAAREISVETAIFSKVLAEMKRKRRTALELLIVVRFRYWA